MIGMMEPSISTFFDFFRLSLHWCCICSCFYFIRVPAGQLHFLIRTPRKKDKIDPRLREEYSTLARAHTSARRNRRIESGGHAADRLDSLLSRSHRRSADTRSCRPRALLHFIKRGPFLFSKEPSFPSSTFFLFSPEAPRATCPPWLPSATG